MSKIIFLSTAFPFRGGISNFTSLFYNQLSQTNDVSVITYKRQYPKLLFPGKSQIDYNNTTDKIPTKQLIDSINPINWIKLAKKVSDENPKIVIISYFMWFFAISFYFIAKQTRQKNKTKIIILAHNVISHESRFFEKYLTKRLFSIADEIIVMSKAVQFDLFSIYPNINSKLLFHPVYTNFGEIIDKNMAKTKINLQTERIILFFGFIREYKGLDVLIKSMKFLTDLKITLLVAGEFYTDSAFYLNLISSEKLENIVFRSDFIPTDEVKFYFSASDLVILPYKSATQSGIAQIANNFLKPIIATNVGGLSEAIQHGKTGFVVESENPTQLAEAIRKFYIEQKETEFRDNIKNELKNYSWESFTTQFEEEINSLLRVTS